MSLQVGLTSGSTSRPQNCK